MSETETFTMGSTAWSVAAPLPMAIYGFASVSFNNKVFFLGELFLILDFLKYSIQLVMERAEEQVF